MKREPVFNKKLVETEEMFRALRKSVLEEHEAELKLSKESGEMLVESRKRDAEEMRGILKKSKINLDSLDKIEKREEKELGKLLSKVRPKFIEIDPNLDNRQREKIARTSFYNNLEVARPTFIGMDILSPDKEYLKKFNAPIVGNPGIWRYEPEEAKDVKVQKSGRGWGCAGTSPWQSYSSIKVIWWWLYFPSKTGLYWILSDQSYHGFYILNANDKWYNCKMARIKVLSYIDIHQYFWLGKKVDTISNRKVTDDFQQDFLYGSSTFDFYVYLGGNDPAVIQNTFYLKAEALGSGSYAEVNFEDGAANYIDAPYTIIVE